MTEAVNNFGSTKAGPALKLRLAKNHYDNDRFQDALKRRERLCMVFVTANGKQREKLLGIITAWDMADFF